MFDENWKIEYHSSKIVKEFNIYFLTYPKQQHCKVSFEKDITTNPYYHPQPKRISKLKQFNEIYRWRKSDTRITYKPHGESKTVFPLEIGTAGNISYKKRSKRKKGR